MNFENETFDTVIIGSGLGGLVCAAILSKEGQRVCVLEKNDQVGGSLQTFQHHGSQHDTGVHYMGSLDKGQNLYQLFQYLGLLERLELKRLSRDAFDVVLFENDPVAYPFAQGYENFKAQMLAIFPEEENAIDEYTRLIKAACSQFPFYNISTAAHFDNLDLLAAPAKKTIAELTRNTKLQSVLAGNNMLYAGVENQTPFYVHALVVNSFIESSWRCAKGGDQLAKLLAKTIKQQGGEVMRKAAVTSIKEADGKVAYVQLSTGEKVRGDRFISNLHPANTLQLLDSTLLRSAYKNRISRLENSVGSFVLYLELEENKVPYTNSNYYYFEQEDVWRGTTCNAEDWPYTYGLFEAVPKKNPQFAEVVSIMTYMKWEEVLPWENSHNTNLNPESRGESYELFKKAKAEKLLAVVAKKFPDLVKHIKHYEASTPLSYRDYLGYPKGSIYGVIKDYNEPIKTMISPNTRLENLFLTGQNIKLHGILGVTLSAFVTCSAILGRAYLIEKVQAANT